jgi:2-polyprenyl-3-methyl-5-hydroxy-6-metoxy-1,4-benzoquinol methylase
MDCCCQCQGIEQVFDDKLVDKQLSTYRTKGADKTTRLMITALEEGGAQGLTLLDIGGGVGAIQHALLEAGVQKATDVDASQAYLHAAQVEAERRGVAEKINFLHGNFVDLAKEIQPADIVTLDRVICCYPDMQNMVRLSAARARKLYGLVYPRDTWLLRLGMAVMNFFLRLRKNPYRAFVHPTREVERLVKENGLVRRYYRSTLFWQVAVFARE